MRLFRLGSFLGSAPPDQGQDAPDDQRDRAKDNDQDGQRQQHQVDNEVHIPLQEFDQCLDSVAYYTHRFPSADGDRFDGFFCDQGDVNRGGGGGFINLFHLTLDLLDLPADGDDLIIDIQHILGLGGTVVARVVLGSHPDRSGFHSAQSQRPL